jgi:predicted  nucleic acid-binding Zn-ribbon protein
MSKRDVYVAKMKQQLDELNANLGQLEEQAKDARADARDTYDREIVRLRADSKAALAKLDEVKAASETAWHKMVSDMEKLRDAFTHSFHYFKSQV